MPRTKPRSEVDEELPAPYGGINLSTAPDKLQPQEAYDLIGFEFDEFTGIGSPRAPRDLGVIVAGATMLSAHIFQRATGPPQLIVHLTDGSVRYSTDFFTTTGTATWSVLASGQSTTAPFAYETWLGKVFMTNGVNDFRAWDGAASITYPTAPKGKFLAVWHDTLWMAGTAVTDRIYSSDPGDPTVWPAFNWVDIGKGEGLDVNAIFATESALVVSKFVRTHVIYDPVDLSNRIIDPSKGCVSHDSVVDHNGTYYFVSHMGVCRHLGDGPAAIISEKIAPIFEDLYVYPGLTTLMTDYPSWNHGARGFSFEGYVGWCLPSNLISEVVKHYPALPEGPWVFGTPALESISRSWFQAVREIGVPTHLYHITGSPAKLFRMYGADVGSLEYCSWKSSWVNFDSPMDEKYLYAVKVLHRGPFNLLVRRDYDNSDDDVRTTKVWPTDLTWNNRMQETIVNLDVYGRCFQLEFETPNTEDIEDSFRKQSMPSGHGVPVEVTRFGLGISRVTLMARTLGADRRRTRLV